ncbi:Uncharacterized protein HZ326_5947 [Fusarium oxysporum f. sp. albedinis]|nr:Uncharacterized protein HZ326_5947 [Fusarium oxysporum f. sp. albedinis]
MYVHTPSIYKLADLQEIQKPQTRAACWEPVRVPQSPKVNQSNTTFFSGVFIVQFQSRSLVTHGHPPNPQHCIHGWIFGFGFRM